MYQISSKLIAIEMVSDDFDPSNGLHILEFNDIQATCNAPAYSHMP